MSIRYLLLTVSFVSVFALATAAARADDCPVRVLSLSLAGKGTSDQSFRYQVVLEAASSSAPRDVDLQVQFRSGRSSLSARAADLQYFQDEGAYDDVVVFDRPSQDVSGVAVVDTLSGDVSNPCTSPSVSVGDQVPGLRGWNNPTVITTFGDAGRNVPDESTIVLQTAKSKEANFKYKADLQYPQIAQSMDVSGETDVSVHLGPAGQLEAARIYTSSKSEVLDDAALDAARRSTFSGAALGGIPIESMYRIVYQFRLDNEPSPPTTSDLLKMYCPAILSGVQLSTGLNSGQAFWYDLNLTTVQARFDSVEIELRSAPSHATDLQWNTLLRGYGDTTWAGHDSSIDYSLAQGALFWPGAALTSGAIPAFTKHATKTATCKPYPADVRSDLVSDSVVAVAQTDRPWLTAPVVETVLPARFATVSWPKYVPDAAAPQDPVAVTVNVHVSQLGEPLVAVVHQASVAPAFASAALNAAMASTYVIPRTADGVPITQTFDVDYLYVPASAAAGNPVGLVSHDRSDGNRHSTPHD